MRPKHFKAAMQESLWTQLEKNSHLLMVSVALKNDIGIKLIAHRNQNPV